MSKKLSLASAILINTNIMLGAGVFINTVLLAQYAGSFSPFVYALVALLLLPLVMVITKLFVCAEGGNCTFYHFGSYVSPYFGFLSAWGYFIAKIASIGLAVHVCISLLQQIIPILQSIPTLLFDSMVLIIFTLLNLLNLRTGRTIQFVFLTFKLVPILFAIFSGLFLFSGAEFTADTLIFSGIPAAVPLVLYAFSGFEASCSLSQSIENPEKNGPRAIYISFFLVMSILVLFQAMFYGSLGTQLASMASYLEAYPGLVSKLMPHAQHMKNTIIALLHIGIASSSLGAAYGILYSNAWNLYTVAHYKHTFFNSLISSFNRHKVPYLCILIEGAGAIIYLLITRGAQVPLQQVGALGAVIAYTFSAIAFFDMSYHRHKKIHTLAGLSLLSCLIMIIAFMRSIWISGISALLLLFFALLIFGSYMFYKKHETREIDAIEDL